MLAARGAQNALIGFRLIAVTIHHLELFFTGTRVSDPSQVAAALRFQLFEIRRLMHANLRAVENKCDLED